MTVRPWIHFATLRIAFGKSLGGGASRYLAFVIFGDFELSEEPWPLPEAPRPPEEVSGPLDRWGIAPRLSEACGTQEAPSGFP